MALRFSTVKRTILAAGVAVALGSAARPAFAYDDGYQNVFSSVLTAVGVMPQEDPPEIDYRERPPLVVPPKQALVPPETPGAKRTAAWPSDPDVVRRRKAAEEARVPVFEFNKTDRKMTKDEQLTYRAAQQPDVAPSGCNPFENSMVNCRPNPDEMKAEEQRFKAANPDKGDAVTAGVEPPREYLTEPPKGYRKANKTLVATHEAPVKKRDESSPLATYIHPVDNKSIDPLNN